MWAPATATSKGEKRFVSVALQHGLGFDLYTSVTATDTQDTLHKVYWRHYVTLTVTMQNGCVTLSALYITSFTHSNIPEIGNTTYRRHYSRSNRLYDMIVVELLYLHQLGSLAVNCNCKKRKLLYS
jgi:hypothetical protein